MGKLINQNYDYYAPNQLKGVGPVSLKYEYSILPNKIKYTLTCSRLNVKHFSKMQLFESVTNVLHFAFFIYSVKPLIKTAIT